MEYSTLEEIYGNSKPEIKTDGNNMNFPPKKDINREQNLHFGSYKESVKQNAPVMANQNIQTSPSLNRRPEEDLASVISDANTVVMGGNPQNELGPIPGYASPSQFATVEDVITQGLLDSQKGNTPIQTPQEQNSTIFEQILEKVNELLTRVDYNQGDEKRSTHEVYVHIGLYFLTGLFILYLLYYVFSLGKQNIKISLIK